MSGLRRVRTRLRASLAVLALLPALLVAAPALGETYGTLEQPEHATWTGRMNAWFAGIPVEIRYRPGVPGDEAVALALHGSLERAWPNAGWVTAGLDRHPRPVTVYVVPPGTPDATACGNTGVNLILINTERTGCDLPEETLAHELVHWRSFLAARPLAVDTAQGWASESLATYAAWRIYPQALARVPRGRSLIQAPDVPLTDNGQDHRYDAYLFWRFLHRNGLAEAAPALVRQYAAGRTGQEALSRALGGDRLLGQALSAFWIVNMNPEWGYGDPVPPGRAAAGRHTLRPGGHLELTLSARSLSARLARLEIRGDVKGIRIQVDGQPREMGVAIGIHRGDAIHVEEAGGGWAAGVRPATRTACRAPEPPDLGVDQVDVAVAQGGTGFAEAHVTVDVVGTPEREDCATPPASCRTGGGTATELLAPVTPPFRSEASRCGWTYTRTVSTGQLRSRVVGTTCDRDRLGIWTWHGDLTHPRLGRFTITWRENLTPGPWRRIQIVEMIGPTRMPELRPGLTSAFRTVRTQVRRPRGDGAVVYRSLMGTFPSWHLADARPAAC